MIVVLCFYLRPAVRIFVSHDFHISSKFMSLLRMITTFVSRLHCIFSCSVFEAFLPLATYNCGGYYISPDYPGHRGPFKGKVWILCGACIILQTNLISQHSRHSLAKYALIVG